MNRAALIGPARWVRVLPLLAFVLAGLTYGAAVARVPSPGEVGVFWVSNLAAPWLLLAFLAGWPQPSCIWAAAAGAIADVATVVGFYSVFLVSPGGYGPSGPGPLATRVAGNAGPWLSFIAPWLAKAVVAGLVFGVLGWWWGRSRSIVAGATICLAFVLEPVWWFVSEGHLPRPYGIWVLEVAAGLAALAWVVAVWSRRARRRRDEADASGAQVATSVSGDQGR